MTPTDVHNMPPPLLPPAAAFSHLPRVATRVLTMEDQPQWSALRDEVLSDLPDPDVYVREDDESAFFEAHVGPRGQTIGVFQGEHLIAYSMIGFPQSGEAGHLGAVVGLAPELLDKVAHISSCMVLPQWRGNGLQRTLLAVRLAMSQAHGRPNCLAMVSLRNHRSRHNLMRLGMHIGWTGDIGGLQRHVLRIDLQSGTHFDMGDERLIDSADFAALCAAGRDGYVGVGELRDADAGRVTLRFVRALRHGALPR
ncbi:GNAT family N-acetyltransferase [Diaphorobacter caeni]|uniref:GNAT family N-acetyltransferase n=1 Tax=Diaphorobacter caeni TaxID=2784387 RepID=UPI00188F2424|nr:GNAT family N-acetyltransferase [Diaphorobacter caeni]MBF5005610.1 hypothetical protein [Diaphorobacter caeni]